MVKKKKKSLKQHAKELHSIGQKYTKHAARLSILHRDKKARNEIKKQITKIEQSIKKLKKLAGRV